MSVSLSSGKDEKLQQNNQDKMNRIQQHRQAYENVAAQVCPWNVPRGLCFVPPWSAVPAKGVRCAMD
jgi:hypothetical protein